MARSEARNAIDCAQWINENVKQLFANPSAQNKQRILMELRHDLEDLTKLVKLMSLGEEVTR